MSAYSVNLWDKTVKLCLAMENVKKIQKIGNYANVTSQTGFSLHCLKMFLLVNLVERMR
jgi:hypothetical protein